MATVSIEDFVGMRIRFQRMRDAKFGSGWLRKIQGDQMILNVRNTMAFEPGDVFRFECIGPLFTTSFEGRLSKFANLGPGQKIATDVPGIERPAMDACLLVSFSSSVKFTPTSEQMRILVPDLPVRLNKGKEIFTGMSSDLSSGGIGLTLGTALVRDDSYDVEVLTDTDSIHCRCIVRHCVGQANGVGEFRIGLQVSEIDRINRTRWNKLVSDVSRQFERVKGCA